MHACGCVCARVCVCACVCVCVCMHVCVTSDLKCKYYGLHSRALASEAVITTGMSVYA